MILCLEGISKEELNICLDYIYHGEVQIYQENIDRFLNVAQRFKIKGLQNNVLYFHTKIYFWLSCYESTTF